MVCQSPRPYLAFVVQRLFLPAVVTWFNSSVCILICVLRLVRFVPFVFRFLILIVRSCTVSLCSKMAAVKDRNADILVRSENVGRGIWLEKGARDLVEEPIVFMVFTLRARVTPVLTNPSSCVARIDVMKYGKETGGFAP